MKSRRKFIHAMAALSAGPVVLSFKNWTEDIRLPISCSSYDWVTFYNRQGKRWGDDLDACIAEFAGSGIEAIEPSFTNAVEVKELVPVLRKYGIALPSAYVNSVLHRKADAEKSIGSVLAIADQLKAHQTKILVTNPSPVKWGGTEVKSDEELREQSRNMEMLGRELKKRGLILAYHTHDTEMLAGAREFHHMLLNTSKENVAFCYDVHWIYRGSQNSSVAVFDVLKLYGDRVVELHLRQSENGIWTEVFGDGDIDYVRFAEELQTRKIRPHLVIEQCIEKDSTANETAVTAHRADLKAVKEIFSKVIGSR